MIKLTNYNLEFNNKVVFKDANFLTQKGEVTLITGESGSGKTSVLNSFYFHNKFQGDYFYNDINIALKDDNEKRKYVCDNISFINQFPLFLNDLTIKQHFLLFGDDYLKYDDLKTIEILGIEKLMNEFPNQLSDGEKKRVSLCLAFLKNSEILLADEPTASLNEEYSILVCKLLRKYAKKGHYVIVASHDLIMNEYVDCLYNIQYCQLKLIKEKREQISITTKVNNIKISFKQFILMYISYIRNKTLLFIITIFLVVFVAVSTEFNNIAISVHSENINDLSSLQVQVYKSIGKNSEFDYSEEGGEFPITDEEFKALKSIKNIEDIHWRFDYSITSSIDENLQLRFSDLELVNQEIVIFDDEIVMKQGIDDEVGLANIMVKTYNRQMDFKSSIEKSFQQDGVYISKDLALSLGKGIDDLRGKTIQLPVYIPIYDVSGVSSKVIENGAEFEMNAIATKKVLKIFPIAGVLKQQSLYETDYNSSNRYQFFIPQEFIEELAKENKKTKDILLYDVLENEKIVPYYNEYPKGKNVVQTIKATPWKSNNYIITVNKLVNLKQVLADISELGFDARCIYIDSTSLKTLVDNMQNTTRIAGGVILVILLLVTLQTKRSNKELERENNDFLRSMGIDNQSIRKIKMKKYFIYFVIHAMICLILSFIGVKILNVFMFGNTNFSVLLCLLVITICFITEFMFPNYVERKIIRR